MEENRKEEAVEEPSKEERELEELVKLESALTQTIEFLGQVYVSLSGFHASEEFLCEQYAASIRFMLRCFSGSSLNCNSEALFREQLTSRTSPARNSFKQSRPKSLRRSSVPDGSSTSKDSHIEETTTVREGRSDPNNSRLQTIDFLCECIDSVLVKAKRIREKSTTGTERRKAGTVHLHSVHKSTGKRDLTTGTKSDNGRADAVKSVTNKKKLFTTANAGKRAKKLAPRELQTKVPDIAFKSPRPSPRNVEESNDSGAIPEEATVIDRSLKKGKKPWGRSRLQFPVELCNLLAWFKSKGISLEDPLNVPRADAQAAKEDFLSVLDEVNNQEGYPNHKETREAALIEEVQSVLKELASHVSPLEMSRLLRVAPAGSTIAKQRDFGVLALLRTRLEKGLNAPLQLKSCQVHYSGAVTPLHHQSRPLSWLPQICWKYFGQALESLRCDHKEQGIEQMLRTTFTCYDDPEHVLVMARLWHVIQVTLFQCHLEDVVAAPLLPSKPSRKELSLVNLFRCRLAHSILCKEGRGLMVMAERVVTSS